MKTVVLSFSILILIAFSTINAQTDRAGKFGIGYSGNLTSSTNAITLTVWAADNIVVEPQIGFNRIEVENNEANMYRLGFGILYNVSELEVIPYIGFRINAAIASGGDESYTDMIYAIAFGGEYFISNYFSVGAELRLNYADTDEDFSPLFNIENASIISTEQVLNIKLYFR